MVRQPRSGVDGDRLVQLRTTLEEVLHTGFGPLETAGSDTRPDVHGRRARLGPPHAELGDRAFAHWVRGEDTDCSSAVPCAPPGPRGRTTVAHDHCALPISRPPKRDHRSAWIHYFSADLPVPGERRGDGGSAFGQREDIPARPSIAEPWVDQSVGPGGVTWNSSSVLTAHTALRVTLSIRAGSTRLGMPTLHSPSCAGSKSMNSHGHRLDRIYQGYPVGTAPMGTPNCCVAVNDSRWLPHRTHPTTGPVRPGSAPP